MVPKTTLKHQQDVLLSSPLFGEGIKNKELEFFKLKESYFCRRMDKYIGDWVGDWFIYLSISISFRELDKMGIKNKQ